MDFEDILKDVGGFGLYQKILVIVFLIPSFIVIPWFSMNLIFMSNTPDHWCYVPEVFRSNLSLELQKQLVRPLHDSSCSMHDVNYSEIIQSGNLTVDYSWPTKACGNGWVYDKEDYDATAVTRWDMVCKDGHFSSLVLSLIFIGDVLGTPFYGFLSDKVGRKPVFLFLALLIAITEIGSVLSPNFVMFLVLRTINGSAMSTIYGVGYIIFLELVNPEIRARMNGLATTSWTIGLCLLPLIAWWTRNWVRLSIVTTSVAASLVLYWKLLPESPSWLISEERYDEAHSIMVKISKMNGKTAHEGNQLKQKIEKLGERIKKQKAGEERHSPMDFFKYPTLRKRFLLVTVCWVGNSIPYFGLQMNVKNLAGSEFFNFFLVSLVEVPSHFATWMFMERIGRRWCSVLAFTVSTTACLMPVVFPSDYALVGVIASLFAKAGTSSAFMTLYQQSPELFPTSLRGVGMGLSSTIGTGSTLLVPYIVYLAKYGSFIPFLVFFIITFLSGICASFLPETLNKKLPQTVTDAENFENNFKFFSCSAGIEPESNLETVVQNSWTPATLTAADLTSPYKSAITGEPGKDPVLLKRTSISSGLDIAINPAA